MITSNQVKHIAKLARLKFSNKQFKQYQQQLAEVLGYVDQLQKVNTKNIEPCSGGTQLKNVFRQDKKKKTEPEIIKKILENTPLLEKGLIKVKAVFDK